MQTVSVPCDSGPRPCPKYGMADGNHTCRTCEARDAWEAARLDGMSSAASRFAALALELNPAASDDDVATVAASEVRNQLRAIRLLML